MKIYPEAGNPRIIMIIGHAKLKDGTATKETSSIISVALQIETVHGVIISCESSLNLPLAKQFPENLVIGYSIVDELNLMGRMLNESYIGLTGNAFLAAIQDANRQFLKWCETRNGITDIKNRREDSK